MKLLLKIAWRNILKHKGKSIIIALILFLGALLMTVGNGIISGMDTGLKNSIVDKFIGHIVLISDEQDDDNVIFTAMGTPVEVIDGYNEIKTMLDADTNIDKYLPVGKEMVMLFNEDAEPGYALLMGVDFEEYQKMFNNSIRAVEGNLLKKDERGVLITSSQREEFFNYYNFWCLPKNSRLVEENLSDAAKLKKDKLITRDELVIMGFNDKNSALDIRADIKGIIKFESLNTIWGNINFCDFDSFRECFGWITSNDADVELTQEQEILLNIDETNIESLFGGADISDLKQTAANSENTQTNETLVVAAQTAAKPQESGACNMVFIKLKNDKDIKNSLERLTAKIKELNLKCRVIPWDKAVGQIAGIASVIRISLFGFVMMLFFVAAIIIMNTLSMTAIERISEIGMMRAVGATKGFISMMFAFETFILSFIFGGLGIICGIIITKFIAAQNITTTNDFIQLLYGGDTFHPLLSGGDIIVGIIQLLFVTIISVIYPIIVARKITPLDAVSRE